MAVSDEARVRYYALRAAGHSNLSACRIVGIHHNTPRNWPKPGARGGEGSYDDLADAASRKGASGIDSRMLRIERQLAAPKPLDRLSPEALRALDDFPYWRHRYLGRRSTPWQEEAAYSVVEWLKSPETELVVVNCPPGSGKSTLFTHDIPAWLICRDRSIRVLIGSRTFRLSTQYSNRIRRLLERVRPVAASPAHGRPDVAEGCLAQDYGRFKPELADIWRQAEFTVASADESPLEDKEPTVSAFGMDSEFLGARANLAIWDDLVVGSTLRTIEATENQRKWWDEEGVTRVEPGGAMILQGQRMGPEDLYRYALDQKIGEEVIIHDDGSSEVVEDSGASQYRHILYPAHFEDRCVKDHGPDAKPYPEGCLLDPIRIPWRGRNGLTTIMRNRSEKYRVQYQQEDVDPANVLVKHVWITGGTDPDTKEHCPGCWDADRGWRQLPRSLSKPWFSIATADPSPTKFWCVAEGTPVLTEIGEVPIERVRPGDRVLTRSGYRRVLDSARTGHKQVLDIRVSDGSTLRLTPEHLVATLAGWSPARELLPGSVLVAVNRGTRPAGPLPLKDAEVGAGVGMTSRAVGAFGLGLDVRRSGHVGPMAFDGEMIRVAAERPPAQVADLHVLWDQADQRSVRQAMRGALVGGAVALDPRPVPDPAAIFDVGASEEVGPVDRDFPFRGFHPVPTGMAAYGLRTLDHGPAFTDVHVVSITAGATTDVYDLAVEDCPEFAANGVLVHNSIQWWIYHPETEQRFLMDLVRQGMDAPDFLDWYDNSKMFGGIMDDWQRESLELGFPISHWIVENNAAQRFLLQYDYVKRWQRLHGVTIIPHSTGRNKLDPEYGIQTLANKYRFGNVRLPGLNSIGPNGVKDPGRIAAMKLVDEVTKYPEAKTDDCLMAQWFLEYHLPTLAKTRSQKPVKLARPSFMRRQMANAR